MPKQEKVHNFDSAIKAAWAEMRPDFSDFKDVYDAEKLKQDEVRLKEKRARIFAKGAFDKSEDFELGEDFEYCLMEAFHERDWFDDSVSVSPGSEFDDNFHGIDLVLTFETEEAQFEYLAIDATVAQDPDTLAKKQQAINNNLRQGRLAVAEYFLNDQNQEIRGRTLMPQINLGLLPAEAVELRNLLGKGKALSFDDAKRLQQYRDQIVDDIEKRLVDCIELLEEYDDLPDALLRKKRDVVKDKYQTLLQLIQTNRKR
jgi:hypothetical protein